MLHQKSCLIFAAEDLLRYECYRFLPWSQSQNRSFDVRPLLAESGSSTSVRQCCLGCNERPEVSNSSITVTMVFH